MANTGENFKNRARCFQISSRKLRRLSSFLSIGMGIVLAASISPEAWGDSWRTISRIVREAAEVGDEIPLRQLDELKPLSRRGRFVEETLERKVGKKIVGSVDEARHLETLWGELLGPGQKQLFREIKSLPIPEQRLAYLLSVGGREVKQAIPDVGMRANLIRRGGPDTLLTLGRYPDLAEDALRFDLAVKNGRIVPPPGTPAVEMADFGRFFVQTGERGHYFWNKYVRPHWKLWVGGCALAAIMLAPDEYLDEIGNLTKAGFAKLTRFASKSLLQAIEGATQGTIQGTGEGLKGVIESAWRSFAGTFLTGWSGPVALLCVVAAVILFVKPLRYLIVHLPGKVYRLFFAKNKARLGDLGAKRED
ncbi:hypothetical protein [Thermogutta sp.]|uniref:hypothetical protein n=1 Tax=Thermogutta sp. TaxID=1962930 RepID=UPI00321FB935